MNLNSFFHPQIHLRQFLKNTADKIMNQPTYTATRPSQTSSYKPSPKSTPSTPDNGSFGSQSQMNAIKRSQTGK